MENYTFQHKQIIHGSFQLLDLLWLQQEQDTVQEKYLKLQLNHLLHWLNKKILIIQIFFLHLTRLEIIRLMLQLQLQSICMMRI
uniref:Uncharacterized protein n=1 Tax=Coptotermes formosanus TaxID=36987 RepID=R4V399_COPFO|nr:hypothetical protein [Coptotermes formosanus]